MRIQHITKLPEERALSVAVRRACKPVRDRTVAIASPNTAELYVDDIPSSLLSAVNDPRYGGSGPPPVNLDMLRYQAWLGSRSSFPDGLVCWKDDPNPSAQGPRWAGWAGAQREYRRRSRASENQKGHELPRSLPNTVSCRDGDSHALEVFAIASRRRYEEGLHDEAIKALRKRCYQRQKLKGIVTQGNGVPDPVHQQVEHGNIEFVGPPDLRPAVPKAKRVRHQKKFSWKALRIRDRMRTDNTRLVRDIPSDDKRYERYVQLCDKYNVHRNQRVWAANGEIKIHIKAANMARHERLCWQLEFPLTKKVVDVKAEIQAEERGSWEDLTVLALIDDLPPGKKDVPKSIDAEVPAVKETVMSPTEEQELQSESVEDTSHHEGTPYGEHLKAMADGRACNQPHLAWVQMVVQMRRSLIQETPLESALDRCVENKAERITKAKRLIFGRRWARASGLPNRYATCTAIQVMYACDKYFALKVGTMGEGGKDTPIPASNDVNPKYNGTLKYSECVLALQESSNTMSLKKKSQDVHDFLVSVGGPKAFEKSESGLLLPPGKEISCPPQHGG